LCSDDTSHAERGMAPSGVLARTTVAVRWITCMGPGPSTESDVLPSTSPARKGGCARRCVTSSLQLRCKRIESFAPARSASCLRSAPQADVDCNRSCVSECAHPVWLYATSRRAVRFVWRKCSGDSQQCPVERCNSCSGWDSCSFGRRAVERNALIQDWYSLFSFQGP